MKLFAESWRREFDDDEDAFGFIDKVYAGINTEEDEDNLGRNVLEYIIFALRDATLLLLDVVEPASEPPATIDCLSWSSSSGVAIHFVRT